MTSVIKYFSNMMIQLAHVSKQFPWLENNIKKSFISVIPNVSLRLTPCDRT